MQPCGVRSRPRVGAATEQCGESVEWRGVVGNRLRWCEGTLVRWNVGELVAAELQFSCYDLVREPGSLAGCSREIPAVGQFLDGAQVHCGETAGVVEGFGALGNAVAHSGQEYQSNDQAQGEHLASIWGR